MGLEIITPDGFNGQAFVLPSDATRPRASETVYIVQPETRLTNYGFIMYTHSQENPSYRTRSLVARWIL